MSHVRVISKNVIAQTEIACPMSKVDLCGPLVLEKERYARLEDEFEKIVKNPQEEERFRAYFTALLGMIECSFHLYALLDISRYEFEKIEEIRKVYYFQKRNKVDFWIFFDNDEWEAEDKVYDMYERMLSTFPKYDIGIKLLRLWGRKPEDLVPYGGVKLLGN